MKHHGHKQERGGHFPYLSKDMSRKNPPGDSGMRPPGASVNSDPVRESAAKSHSLGPREA